MRHPDNLPFEYSRITNYIYIGTDKCCKGRFVQELLEEGIEADISLERKRIDTPFGVEVCPQGVSHTKTVVKVSGWLKHRWYLVIR